MKLNRSGFLLLAAAVLVAGVAVWYLFLRGKATKSTGAIPVGQPAAVVPGPTPGATPVDGVTFTPGPADDPDNPIRIQVDTNWEPQSGRLRVGSATNLGTLDLKLLGNRLVGRKGQVRNDAYLQAQDGLAFKYLVDNNSPYLDSIDGLWFGVGWPHTMEVWEVDPNQQPYTWRVDSARKGQTVFILVEANGNYES